MEQDINLMIENFKQNLLYGINTAQLPPSIIYYVLKDVFEETQKAYFDYVNQAKQKLEAAQKAAAAPAAEELEESNSEIKEED